MLLWLLFTVLDFFIAGSVLLTHFGVLDSWRILFSGAVYLIGKGFMFQGSFLSILDIVCGVYLLLMLLGVRSFIDYIVFGYLIYKVLIYFILR